jgi:ribonuclease HII
MIVGIDEVGRGAWAGPLVVGAVLLGSASIKGLTDSKKLTKKQRERLDLEIRQKAQDIGIGWVSARDIDVIGLGEALKLASRRALAQIRHDYKEIIIDGTIRLIDDPRVSVLKKADLLIPSVSAASIVAKVARDSYMTHVGGIFKEYGFAAHVGYGTVSHRRVITEQGVSPIHRLSFAPLRKHTIQNTLPKKQSTKSIGDLAEDSAAEHLVTLGHVLLHRNWKTRFCEIDIISRCGRTIYFTEVKYRSNGAQGGGIAAITPKKLQQMAFAADFFTTKHNITTTRQLAVMSLTGTPPRIETYLEIT